MKLPFNRMRPLMNRILVKKPDAQKVSKGGIILKSTESAAWGTVIATGPGRTNEDGSLRPMGVVIGDNVLQPEYGGSTIKIGADNEELHIFRDDDILGILEDKKTQ